MSKELTVKQIDCIEPVPNKIIKTFDSELLYIFTSHTGRKTWKVIYTFNGNKNTTTLGEYPILRPKEARTKRDEIKRMLIDGIDPNKKKKKDQLDKMATMSFSELLKKYIAQVIPTHKGGVKEQSRLDKLIRDYPKLMQKPVDKIDQLDMIELRNDRLKYVSPSTVGRDLGVLGGVFKYARQELRIIENSPLSDISKPPQAPHRERRISDDEIKLIMNGFKYDGTFQPINKKQQVAWAFLFAIETAMRASEINGMLWSNVYDNFVLLPDTKNGTSRKVPLSKRATELLTLMKGLDAERVMTTSQISNVIASDFWKVVSNKLNIDDLNFHDTRHEATTRLAQKLPIQDLAKVTGHKDLKMLMRYYNPTVDELANKINAQDEPNIIPFKKVAV